MKKLRLVSPLLVALGLAACGGGESGEEKITGTIETAFVKTDPESCTALMTQAFSEQSFRAEGASAVESCEQNARAEESDNPPVVVRNVEIRGSKATADVSSEGSFDGQAFTVSLVDDGGTWKLDEIVRIADFDRRAFLREERRGFESGEDRFDPKAVDCILRAYREMPRARLEELFLGGSAQPEIEIYESCE